MNPVNRTYSLDSSIPKRKLAGIMDTLLCSLGVLCAVCSLFALLFVATPASVFAQPAPTPDRRDDPSADELANTASGEAYMSPGERKAVYLINMARLRPQEFAREYLPFVADTTTKGYRTLRLRLARLTPLHALRPIYPLYRSAATQATEMGQLGLEGTSSAEGRPYYDRIHQQLPGARLYASGYFVGSGEPLEIVLGWLTGSSDTTLLAQQGLLSAKVDFIGVSIRAHKRGCSNAIVDISCRPAVAQEEHTLKERNKKSVYFMDCPTSTKVIRAKRNKNTSGLLGWLR
jgi:hypothetical protein